MCRTIILLILTLPMPVFASRTVVTQTPYFNPNYGAYYGGDYIPKSKYQRRNHSFFQDINDLEKYALNKNFTRDSDRTRIERLETLAFGAVQEGDIYTRYNNVRNAILSRPKPNYKTSVLKNISDYFNGQLTGYTPSLTQSNYYNTVPEAFGKSYSFGKSTPWSSSNSTGNYGTSSGSSVHILD